jgi:hypothetical protein
MKAISRPCPAGAEAFLVQARLELDRVDPQLALKSGLIAEDAGERCLGLVAPEIPVLDVAGDRAGDAVEGQGGYGFDGRPRCASTTISSTQTMTAGVQDSSRQRLTPLRRRITATSY